MRRVLMVSPHFPPDSSAASHRVRLLAPHLERVGWEPTVVTIDPSAYESRLDPNLERLVPPSLRIVRAPAWPARWTRRVGIGDLGVRAFTGIRQACRKLLATHRFDALFVTVYPVYPALLGGALKSEFHVPFVLDYQDPWVGAWGRSVGSAADGGADWKSRASRRLGVWLEPRAVRAADALVAVSQGTLDGIVERLPTAARTPQLVLPLGFEAEDFERLRTTERSFTHFDPGDGLVHLCYVGTLLPTGVDTLRLLLRGLVHARANDRAAARLRLHFFGTSNQSSSDRDRVLPLARELGVSECVSEHAARLDYFDALDVLSRSSGILLLGSSEPHYTASKLYPALLARRPLLAVFHDASSVVTLLRRAGSEPTVRVVSYGHTVGTDDQVNRVAGHLQALAASPEYRAGDVRLDDLAFYSAQSLAADLAGLFDRVAA
jgi:glycosyltransferase involved in cell wall biosynthesis